MHDVDMVSWITMIVGHAQDIFFENTLNMFRQMQLLGVKPKSIKFFNILLVCFTMEALEECMDIHQIVFENIFALNVMGVNALIDVYVICGRKARDFRALLLGVIQNPYKMS